MERINQALAEARIDLLKKQDWLDHVRKGHFPTEFIKHAITLRHIATDRVWDLQNMASPSF